MAKKKAKMGAPRTFKTAASLQKKANQYFNSTKKEMWTLTGLCLHLGVHKQTLYDWRDNREDLSDSVKVMLTAIEHTYELSLKSRGNAGDIFALKNFGWKDKTEVEHSVKPQPLLDNIDVKQVESKVQDEEIINTKKHEVIEPPKQEDDSASKSTSGINLDAILTNNDPT